MNQQMNMNQQSFDYSLFDAIAAILRNKWTVSFWVFGTIFVVGILTLIVPKTFKSEGKLFVRLGRENSSLDATTTLGEHTVVAMPLTREAEINSVTELIKNRSIYEQVVDQIGPEIILKMAPFVTEDGGESDDAGGGGIDVAGLVIDPIMGVLTAIGAVNDLSPRERAIIRLSKDLSIEPLEKSNVVQIEFESHDPRLAQAVVMKMIGFYEKAHAKIHRGSGSFDFLKEQTERIQSELETAENEFEAFKNLTGILDVAQQRKVFIDRISVITDKKLEADAQLAGIEKEIETLNNNLGSMSDTKVVQSTKGPGQEGVDGMREEFFKLELQISGLKAKYNDEHPAVIRANQQLEAIRKVMEAEESTRGEEVQGVNEVFEQTKVTLIIKEAEKVAARKKAEEYARQIAKLEGALEKFNADEKEFLRLQRQFVIKDQAFRKYTNNLEQGRIDDLLQASNLSNISVAQPATLSFKPSKPNKLLNLLLAFVFGSMIGVGLVVYRDYQQLYDAMANSNADEEEQDDDDEYMMGTNQFAVRESRQRAAVPIDFDTESPSAESI